MRRLVDEFRASERRVCGLMEIPRMSYRYRTRRDDNALRERLLALAREKPRFGYRRLWVMLTSEERVNHKRVWRVYRDLGLSVKRTRRKRLERALRPRPVLSAPNQEWAVDFVSDVAARREDRGLARGLQLAAFQTELPITISVPLRDSAHPL